MDQKAHQTHPNRDYIMKKLVAKKIVKPRKPLAPAHRKWTVYWIRTVNNDEFIAYAKPSASGVVMAEATIITTFQDQMILAPYGTMSKDKLITLKKEHVLHVNEASDSMREFYAVSTSTS